MHLPPTETQRTSSVDGERERLCIIADINLQDGVVLLMVVERRACSLSLGRRKLVCLARHDLSSYSAFARWRGGQQ